MTQSDEITDEAVREGSPPGIAEPEINAQARARARATIPEPFPVSLQAVTACARWARVRAGSAVAVLDREGSLIDAQPPTLRQVRAWHRDCARHYDAGLIRWPRALWGWIHLIVITPLRAAEWITASPARLAVALAVAAALWHWS